MTTGDNPKIVTFSSGASREKGKHAYHGIPGFFVRRLADIFTEGIEKYGEDNWTKGMPSTDVYDHLMDHLMLYRDGDRSQDNLAKVAWGVMALMFNEIVFPNLALRKYDEVVNPGTVFEAAQKETSH